MSAGGAKQDVENTPYYGTQNVPNPTAAEGQVMVMMTAMMTMMMTRMTAKDDDTRGDSGMLGAAESAAGNQSLISVSMWKCTRSVPDDHCGDDDDDIGSE